MIENTEAYGLSFAFPARDTAVGASLRDHGEFARPELDFLLAHATDPGGVFVDVGANLGAISLPFAAARPGWRVISVEAYFAMAQLLEGSAKANALGNVEVLSVAAGAEAGVGDFPAAELHNGGNFGSLGFYTTETDKKRRVGIMPLDDLAPNETCLVKVDVEGYEPQVLRGAGRLLKAATAVWMIEAHPSRTAEISEIRLTLENVGYRLFWFYSPFVTPNAPKGAPLDITRGDYGLAALPPDRGNTWALPSLADFADPPRSIAAYPYLGRYGY